MYPSQEHRHEAHHSEAVAPSFVESLSMHDYMRACNEGFEDEVALVCGERKLAYGELFQHIDATAQAFRSFGVRSGDTVALCSLSTPETIIAFYALNKIGAVIASVDPRKPLSEVNAYMEEVTPDMTLMLDVFAFKYDVVNGWKGGSCVLLPSGAELPKSSSGVISWADFLQSGKMSSTVQAASVIQDAGDVAVLMHTSGTTGFSKRVMLTNGNFNSIALQYTMAFEFKRQRTFLSVIPFFLCYGLNINVHLPLCAGVTAVLVPDFDASRFADILMATRANYVAGMPYFFEQLVGKAKEARADLSFLEIVACGGDFLKPDAEDRLNEMLAAAGSGARVIKGFGMTELCSTAVTCTPENNPLGSVGKPLPLNEVRILRVEDDAPLGVGETGQICITGPSVMKGYLHNEEDTDKVILLMDGKRWMRTGDAGYLDEVGNLYVTGRVKRSFMRAQAKVYPEVIEAVIVGNVHVEDCAVVGRSVGENEAEPIAFVVANISDQVEGELVEDMLEECRYRLAPHFVPVEVRFLDALPMTDAGKVDYRALEAIGVR